MPYENEWHAQTLNENRFASIWWWHHPIHQSILSNKCDRRRIAGLLLQKMTWMLWMYQQRLRQQMHKLNTSHMYRSMYLHPMDSFHVNENNNETLKKNSKWKTIDLNLQCKLVWDIQALGIQVIVTQVTIDRATEGFHGR